ncbi:hypothetical protein D3C86_2088760 [compost metagenome]
MADEFTRDFAVRTGIRQRVFRHFPVRIQIGPTRLPGQRFQVDQGKFTGHKHSITYSISYSILTRQYKQ